MMNPPICWIGGKSRLRKTIIERIPEHICYVEVFGGAGWVMFGKEPSKIEVYNDIDGELINFFTMVKSCHKAFIQAFDWILVSRKLFTDFINTKTEDLNEIERAVRFYYIIKNSFAGKWHGANFGYAKTERPNFSIDNLYETFTEIHKRLRCVYIEQEDFKKLISRYDGPNTFFYLDPPYYCTKNYKSNFKHDDYVSLKNVLSNTEGNFILSLNDHPEVRKIFVDFNLEEIRTKYSIQGKGKSFEAGELLIRKNEDKFHL